MASRSTRLAEGHPPAPCASSIDWPAAAWPSAQSLVLGDKQRKHRAATHASVSPERIPSSTEPTAAATEMLPEIAEIEASVVSSEFEGGGDEGGSAGGDGTAGGQTSGFGDGGGAHCQTTWR
jgi:hypothetical protein